MFPDVPIFAEFIWLDVNIPVLLLLLFALLTMATLNRIECFNIFKLNCLPQTAPAVRTSNL